MDSHCWAGWTNALQVNLVVGGVEIRGTVGTKSWWNRIPINCGANQPKWKIDPKKEEYPKMGNCTNLSVQILLKFVYQLKIETQFQAYPWCGYRHLLFDTIVKPLDREKEKTLVGHSCHVIYGQERSFVNLKFTSKAVPQFMPSIWGLRNLRLKVKAQVCNPLNLCKSYYLKLLSINYEDTA